MDFLENNKINKSSHANSFKKLGTIELVDPNPNFSLFMENKSSQAIAIICYTRLLKCL
jgi:hypothetical protein